MGLNATLADTTYSKIKSDILSGSIPQGTRVSEALLAKEYGVSRTPVREAVRRLSEQGLVKLRPCSHMEVTCPTDRQKNQILELHAFLNIFALDHIAPSALKANGSILVDEAEKAYRELSSGNKSGMINHTAAFCHSFYSISEHEPLLHCYKRSVEPMMLLILSAYHADDEHITDFAEKQSHYAALLCDGRIADAKTMIRLCVDSIMGQ